MKENKSHVNGTSSCPFPINQSLEEGVKQGDGAEERAADLDSAPRYMSF